MYYSWRPYVSVAARRAKAKKEMEKLRKKGKDIQPVELDGRKIAASFWGKGWCDHLESFSDFENRLPRGRTYIRNGSVCHLDVQAGQIEAFVSGSELYKVSIKIKPLVHKTWNAIKAKCQGQIGSVLELLQGKLSNHVMAVVSHRAEGLFPQPGEIDLKCSCPDWATMCKHVAAVLYGVGSRLDHRPELLFVLRGVDAEELISAEVALPVGAGATGKDTLAEAGLAEIFGIDIDAGEKVPTSKSRKARAAKPPAAIPIVPITKKPRKTAKAKQAAAPKPPVFDPTAPTGEAIALLRKQSGLSVTQFARALEVTPASIYRWESIPGPLKLQGPPRKALALFQDRISGE